MKPLRLVLVSRRFWPLVGGAETVMARLAQGWARQGHAVTLLTARWDAGWPETVRFNGVMVRRLPQPQRRFMGTFCYMRALGEWFRRNRAECDLAYVSMHKHDAYTAVGQGAKLGFPVVLRAEGTGQTGDMAFHAQANFGLKMRARCRAADGFVAPTTWVADELLAAGYPAERLRIIPNGVPIAPLTSAATRHAARMTLALTDLDFALPDRAMLCVYTGRFHPAKGLSTLVEAWRKVVDVLPGAHLWLVGDGPERQALQQLVDRLRLGTRVAVAGPFEIIDDVLQAADAFVLPSREEGLSMSLLEAMACGLPIVAADISGNRIALEPYRDALLVPPGNPDRLADALVRILESHEWAARLGEAARRRALAEFSLDAVLTAHTEWFRERIAAKAAGRTAPET